jgi:hypothetical protein
MRIPCAGLQISDKKSDKIRQRSPMQCLKLTNTRKVALEAKGRVPTNPFLLGATVLSTS